MDIYLPIAEMPVSVLITLAMGGAVGFISGMFGVGGGFLLTPLLIFSGVPPAYAIASVTPQIVASSASGALSYARRGGVDFKLAGVLIAAGGGGAVAGAYLFAALGTSGQLQVVISISYTLFLATIGALMVNESLHAMIRRRRELRTGQATAPPRRSRGRNVLERLPLKMRFPQSQLYVSVLPIIAIGGSISFLGTLLGIGGGFILVPALIYILKVRSSVVVGTSLVQIVGVMAIATVMHSVASQAVDVVLAFLLMIGGVIGAQLGASLGQALRGEQMRALLGLLVLLVGLRFAYGLVGPPGDLYRVMVIPG